MKYIIYLVLLFAVFVACDNSDKSKQNETPSYVRSTDIDGDTTLADDTIGYIEKDTLPIIVKEAEPKED